MYPHVIMTFALPGFICVVISHDLLRSNIVFIYTQINFILRNNRFCHFNCMFQSDRSVSLSSIFFLYAVSDMPRTISQRFCKTMPNTEFTNQNISIPQITSASNRLSYRPRNHSYLYKKLDLISLLC